MREQYIEQKAVRIVKQYLGIIGGKLTIPGHNGFPDRIFWIPGGKPLLIEFKRPGAKLSPTQMDRHEWLLKLGYMVETCTDELGAFDLIITALRKIGFDSILLDAAEKASLKMRRRRPNR